MKAYKNLVQIITEEISKTEISNMIASKFDSKLSSKEFEKRVKEITADVLDEFYKLLYQKNNFWKSSLKK